MDAELLRRAKAIKLLICDVDGVLTDGSVFLGNGNEELKAFNIKNGFNMRAIQQFGIEVALITGRQSHLVERRAAELQIRHVFQGNSNKRGAYADLLSQLKLSPEQTAHMGDDLPDLPLFLQVGLAAAPADAHPVMREHAHYISRANGGAGAVREVCDLLLQAQGHWPALLAGYYP
jgi:3-deoxy-D-manno-octulosonate 8-phosphate phosphatase (KDO 8-P phosphatase)